MTKVSVVIPCHNDGQYLEEALASVAAQTHADVEVIVVDDNSTDAATLRVLGALRKGGTTVLQGPGTGPAAARNMAIAQARGEYILPLDADDWIASDYVAKAAAVLDAKPDVGVCYCDVDRFGLKRGVWRFPPFSAEGLLLGDVLITVTSMFRKADWEAAGGFDETLQGLEDYDFWINLLSKGVGFHKIEEVLFHCRIRGNSRTARMFRNGQERSSLLYIYDKHHLLYQQHGGVLFSRLLDLNEERAQRECLFSWRCAAPLLRLEWRLRQAVKRLLGRC